VYAKSGKGEIPKLTSELAIKHLYQIFRISSRTKFDSTNVCALFDRTFYFSTVLLGHLAKDM
jgi:hypothetical protein